VYHHQDRTSEVAVAQSRNRLPTRVRVRYVSSQNVDQVYCEYVIRCLTDHDHLAVLHGDLVGRHDGVLTTDTR